MRQHHEPRGNIGPRLSSRAKLDRFCSSAKIAELRSAGQPRAGVPTRSVVIPHERGARAYIYRCPPMATFSSILLQDPYESIRSDGRIVSGYGSRSLDFLQRFSRLPRIQDRCRHALHAYPQHPHGPGAGARTGSVRSADPQPHHPHAMLFLPGQDRTLRNRRAQRMETLPHRNGRREILPARPDRESVGRFLLSRIRFAGRPSTRSE